jgi:hypothetical protein
VTRKSSPCDVLDPAYPLADVQTEIRKAGGDPVAIGRRGAALAKSLLDKRRLAWQDRARERTVEWAADSNMTATIPRLSRRETLAHINAMRSDPGLAPIVANFHKRKPEDASDDELHQIRLEMELLRRRIGQQNDGKK